MTQLNQVYKCNICGNVVTILHTGAGQLVCCNQPMQLLEEKTKDEGQEKHVPVIVKKENKVVVKVGSIPHPMEQNHYIEWIELTVDKVLHRKFLSPDDPPEAEFPVNGQNLTAREYCNLHGLWK